MTATMKFSGVLGVVHQMAHAGFIGGKLVIVATFELLSAVLFLYPMSPPFGLVFLSAFLGVAVCTHVQMGELQESCLPECSQGWRG